MPESVGVSSNYISSKIYPAKLKLNDKIGCWSLPLKIAYVVLFCFPDVILHVVAQQHFTEVFKMFTLTTTFIRLFFSFPNGN